MKNKRLDGIDFARSLALLGMILVNFKVVYNAEITEGSIFYYFFSFIEGKAAALFIFIAGIGISLAAKSKKSEEELKKYKMSLFKRSVSLLVTGLLYYPIWPADILHFYSFYILIGIFLLNVKQSKVFIISVSVLMLSLILLLLLDYSAGWDFVNMAYVDFWSIKGFIRHIFFNGFHPVVPWVCFFIWGMLFGRIDFENKNLRNKLLLIFSALFILVVSLSYIIKIFSHKEDLWVNEFELIFGTSPMPPTIFYMLSAALFAGIIVMISIEVCRKNFVKNLFQPMITTGQFALSHYVFHVVIGMTIIELVFTGKKLYADQLFYFGLGYYLLSILFSIIWKKLYGAGPLEKLFKIIINRPQKN